ncbi:MAG: 8-amino-7-oxononanoate synthase [Deltaproteobacteria bacterium]|nr:8-amino-7-oxononanoate synthase [Deltaproteobacteria bacterium]
MRERDAFAYYFEQELSRLKDAGLYRSLSLIQGAQEPRVAINGREVIILCSNNYLGLANHPKIKEAAIKSIEKYGFGSGASRLVSGNMEPHRELEERLARFKGTEAALVFNSGYHANIGIISALVGKGDVIFSDKLNHASIVDGCLLSKAELKRYPHCDMDRLERLLQETEKGRSGATEKDLTAHQFANSPIRKLIITDGIFSMDGDIAPLQDISVLADKYNCVLMVDDAHATWVLGINGKGTLEHFGIDNPDIIQMGTLGKALGCFGAYVAGSRKLIDYLINKARSFIYTTSLPPTVCAAGIAAIDIIEDEPQIRQGLWDRVKFFRKGLKEAGLNTMQSETQIIPILIGEADKAVRISRSLLDKGIFVQAIRPPTVPEGTSRLRITLMANHSLDDLKYALDTIKETVANFA